METTLESCCKDKELREEACKRRNTCQWEQSERHKERQLGIGTVQSVILFECESVGTQSDNRDYCKYREVGKHINKYVIYQWCHTLLCTGNDTQHNVTCLRDTGECHQAFQVFLAQCKEVGKGDRGYDNPVKYFLPLIYHRSKRLDQNCQQHESCWSFGDYTQVSSYHTRSTFIYVGCPEVEGNERELESHTGEEEYECHYLQGVTV